MTGNFNPRTREGCDWIDTATKVYVHGISIHAPVKGATYHVLLSLSSTFLFQSTHP